MGCSSQPVGKKKGGKNAKCNIDSAILAAMSVRVHLSTTSAQTVMFLKTTNNDFTNNSTSGKKFSVMKCNISAL